jgi:GNAT superfamily N-acetyltransferase
MRGAAVVGSVLVEREGAKIWLDLQARDPEAAAALLDWGCARARGLAEGPLLVSTGVWSTDAVATAALESAGFALRRHTNTMGMELDAEPDPPSWPPGIAVRRYEEADARTFYDLTVEAFRDTWEPLEASFEQWEHWQPDRELWALATSGDEPVGVVLCRREESDATRGWINVLAVRRSWRRRGLGMALLLHALGELRRAGCRRAGLGVDAPSRTGAERLYERAGMRVEHRYDLYERSG